MEPFEGLELYDGKLSHTVLRVGGAARPLPYTVAYSNSHFRLKSITDPKGKTFLSNYYDDQGRVIRQEHSNGYFQFKYEPIGETPSRASPKQRGC